MRQERGSGDILSKTDALIEDVGDVRQELTRFTSVVPIDGALTVEVVLEADASVVEIDGTSVVEWVRGAL